MLVGKMRHGQWRNDATEERGAVLLRRAWCPGHKIVQIQVPRRAQGPQRVRGDVLLRVGAGPLGQIMDLFPHAFVRMETVTDLRHCSDGNIEVLGHIAQEESETDRISSVGPPNDVMRTAARSYVEGSVTDLKEGLRITWKIFSFLTQVEWRVPHLQYRAPRRWVT